MSWGQEIFKAALIKIFILILNQMATCTVNGATHCVEPTELSLMSFNLFSVLFWFYKKNSKTN